MELQTIRSNIVQAIRAYRVDDLMSAAQAAGQHFLYANLSATQSKQEVLDGIVFGNREKLLPARPRGSYREYTVKTPGQGGRGARRIVCGGKPPTQPEACFYTDDHYASFRRIAP